MRKLMIIIFYMESFSFFYYQIFSSFGQRVDVVDRELEVFIGILLSSVILRGVFSLSFVSTGLKQRTLCRCEQGASQW